MRQRLVNILSNLYLPMNRGQDTIGEYKLSRTVIEKISDALIENGVILSTYKPGDTVWVYDFMWGIIPCKVDRPYHCYCGKEGSITFEMNFEENDIGKYIFNTKEEAEDYWEFGSESGKDLYLD